LKANEAFKETIKDEEGDEKDIERKPGDRWMIRGPLEYVPSVEVEVVAQREAIPLDENEGIYVRDIRTGKVSHLKPNLKQTMKPNLFLI
jgi:major vault protein